MRKTGFIYVLFMILCSALISCHFFESFDEEPSDDTTLSFDKDNLSMLTGSMDTLSLTVSGNQSGAGLTWTYDEKVVRAVTDNYGVVLTGLSAGQTEIRATYNNNGAYASCLVTVSGDSYKPVITNPYVYASRDYVSLSPKERVRISAALFGGTASDISGFNWSLDRTDVASISTEGNYCWITGLANGTAKLTLRHPKATYAYSVLLDVSGGEYNEPYITTSNNIVTIDLNNSNKTESAVSVKLMNSVNPQNEKFRFSLVDSDGKDIAGTALCPVNIVETAGNLCQLSASKAGDCILRATHEQSKYPLDILVRVLEKTDGSYIELTQPIVTVSGNNGGELKAFIADTDEAYDPSLFEWDFSSDASLYSSWTIYNGNGLNTGDRIDFKGEHTGSFRVTVRYPGMNERSAVIVVRDLVSESSKATTTITTSQSFVSLLENGEVQVDILLSDCSGGDINNLLWSIVNTADDGSSSPVISWVDGNGKSVSKSSRSARSASTIATYNEYAWCRIKGLRPGTATIEISHPKALYSTKIDVKVKTPKPEDPKKSYLSYSTNPLVVVMNGNQATLGVTLSGEGDVSDIQWNMSGGNDSVSILPAADGTCIVNAPSDENAEPFTFNVMANHKYCDKGISFTVYTVRPSDEDIVIPEIPMFYTTEKLYRKTEINLYENYTVNYSNIDNTSVIWKSSREDVAQIITAEDSFCRVQAKAPGVSVISAAINGYPSIEFVLKVTDPRVVSEDTDIYLFSSTRTVFFDNINDDAKTFTVNIAGMNDIENYTKFELSDSSAYSLSYSGNTASVLPLKSDSEAYITVTNPYSINSLTINLRTGSLYVYKNEDQSYIELSKNVVQLLTGQKEESVTAKIIHTTQAPSNNDEKNFIFTSSDNSICEASYVNGSNAVFILPKKEGKATINVHHPDCKYDSEIQVIVNRPGDTAGIPYLTSDTNVITVIEGELEPVSVSIKNLSASDASMNYKFSWQAVGNNGFVEPVAQTGMTCMISGNKPGTQKIRVTHDDCIFPFEFTVICLSSAVVEQKPFIKTDKNIITLKKGESTTLTAQLKGGTSEAADNQFFSWASSSNTSILINPTGSACYVKALETGMTRISIKNTRYPQSYTKEILVIVEQPSSDDCYIRVSDSILRMKPDSTSFFKVTAELVNGSATDAADFIWWCDDYGLVMTNSIAGECSVTSKGQSGTTKLHVKHPKCAQTIDILLSVSEFQDFAFSQQNMTLRAGKIYFIPMQVPAQENDFNINYVSSDTDILYAAGSKQTAFVAPRHAGNVYLTATMTTTEGELMAQTQTLITIEEDDIRIPDISVGSSIIHNMEEGEDLTLSAVISGGNVSEGEKYNLKWEVISGEKGGLIFKNGAADGTFTGTDALLSCIKGDVEYVVRISHSSGAETQLWIKTTKKGEKRIELSTYYEAAYKSDGSFKITATVVNGKNGEQKQIEWTAVKNGGVNVVSVPKTAGPTCTVTPKSEGMTTITARLPDGTYAECQVIILSDAVIKLATSNVHVMPGETTAVSYYTEPANCTLQWYDEMTGYGQSWGSAPEQYFSYTVNETEKKIYITGVKEYSGGVAGTIKGMMTSTKCNTIPTLNVYVEYYSEMTVTDTRGSFLPSINLVDKGDDKTFDKGFDFFVTYSPKEMDIKVDSENTDVIKTTVSKQVITNSVGKEVMQATVHVTVVKEGSTGINITTQLNKEGLTKEVKKSQKISYSGYYENYNISFEPDPNAIAGAFSEYKNGNIYLADGEEILIYAQITNKYAAGEITDIVYSPKGNVAAEFNNAVSVNQNDNRDTVKAKQIWNNGQYNRNLYGSDDSIKPTPNTGLIAIKKENIEGTTKKIFCLKHCFDYYKDVDYNATTLNGAYRTYKNYIETDNIYFSITKDMYWTFMCEDKWIDHYEPIYYSNQKIGEIPVYKTGYKYHELSATMYNNQSIAYWKYDDDEVPYFFSDEGLGIVSPVWYINPYNFFSNYPNSDYYIYRNTDINKTEYYPYNIVALAIDGRNKNRKNYATELYTEGNNVKVYDIENKHKLGLKYPSPSDFSNRTYLDGFKAYVTYKDVTPYTVTKSQILNNANYYIPYMDIHDYNYWGWGHEDDCYVTIYATLMHEYCEPVICPYNYVYNNYNNIYIGYVDIKYKLAIKGNASVPQLCFKNIPVYFSAYKCEAYKKK